MTARCFKCLLPLLFIQVAVFGQSPRPDTLFLTASRQYQQSVYDASIKGQSRLYNGTEHRDYLSRNDETPYFGIDDWQYGFIYYDDERYDSVGMFYDLSTDQVIIEHMLTGAKIELVSKKISRFQMNGHYFERLYPDSARVIGEGFYERLYNGDTKVYVRRTRTLITKPAGNVLEYKFVQRDRIYLFKDHRYYPVKSKKSVYKVLRDKKQEVRAAMKGDRIPYKYDRERAIVKMVQAYDATPE